MRSVKWPDSVSNPAAPIGDPIISSTGAVLASLLRTSYCSTAPGTSSVCVFGSVIGSPSPRSSVLRSDWGTGPNSSRDGQPAPDRSSAPRHQRWKAASPVSWRGLSQPVP